MLTTRWTSQPQRWAAVPAAVMAVTGVALLAVTPDNGTLTAAGWVWPPAALVLAVWMVRAARSATTGRTRWLLYPAIGLVTVTAVGGAVETVTLAHDRGRLRDDRRAVRRGRTPPAPDLHRHRQPHRRPRERPERDLAAVERHRHPGFPQPPGSAPTTGPARAGATTSPTRRTGSPSPPTCTPCWPAPASTAPTSWPVTPPAARSP